MEDNSNKIIFDSTIINKIENKEDFKKKKGLNNKVYKYLFIILIVGFILTIIYLKNQKNIHNRLNLKKLTFPFRYEEFDEKIKEKYIQFQNKFCEQQNDSLIPEFEKRITLANADYLGKRFNMFVHTGKDYISKSILYSFNWEAHYTLKVMRALDYYANKKKLENKDIYFLDIGSNVGWYTFFLGKFGYNIISFEASNLNNYILHKNYCLNKDVNVTIINRGLDDEDKSCSFKESIKNNGNGMIFCENRDKNSSEFSGETTNNIELTKLSRYVKFLSSKNLAFVKIDVEGDEENVINGGKELFTEYHVPFIMLEFDVALLDAHRTKAFEFLNFFDSIGYKISLNDFYSKYYATPKDIMEIPNILNLFLTYEKFLD